jgi:hypothetical protein
MAEMGKLSRNQQRAVLKANSSKLINSQQNTCPKPKHSFWRIRIQKDSWQSISAIYKNLQLDFTIWFQQVPSSVHNEGA